MPDRVRDALTLESVKPPGTYFEYAQSPVALLAEIVGRSAGEDVMAFGQRELMTRSGSRRARGTGRATRPATSRASTACA